MEVDALYVFVNPKVSRSLTWKWATPTEIPPIMQSGQTHEGGGTRMVVGVDQYKRIRKMAAEGGLSQSVYCRLKTDNRRKRGLQKTSNRSNPRELLRSATSAAKEGWHFPCPLTLYFIVLLFETRCFSLFIVANANPIMIHIGRTYIAELALIAAKK